MIRPSQIRDRVLAHHDVVNEILDDLERLADSVGDGRLGELHSRALELEVALAALMDEEVTNLDPALRETDAFGDVRAAQLERCYERRRSALARIRSESKSGRIAHDELGSELRAVVEAIRRELDRERRQLLSADLLRDDLVAVAQSDG